MNANFESTQKENHAATLMSSTTFANTDEGAAALRRAIIDHINSDPKLIESSREQRRRNAGVIIYAARLLLTADAEHAVHVWFSPEVLRALNRPRSNDALASCAGKAIEYLHPTPREGEEDTRPEAVQRTLAQLELMKARRSAQRQAEKRETPPPPLEQFKEPALKLAKELLAAETMHPKDVCCVLMILGVNTRVNGFRDAKWGTHISFSDAERPSLRVRMGTPRGGKNNKLLRCDTADAPMRTLELNGVIAPSTAAAVMHRYYQQVKPADGELVFAPKGKRLGENTIGTRFNKLTDSNPSELRRRIAWETKALVAAGKIDDSVTAYLVQNMQHEASTHVGDYEGTDSDSGSDAEDPRAAAAPVTDGAAPATDGAAPATDGGAQSSVIIGDQTPRAAAAPDDTRSGPVLEQLQVYESDQEPDTSSDDDDISTPRPATRSDAGDRSPQRLVRQNATGSTPAPNADTRLTSAIKRAFSRDTQSEEQLLSLRQTLCAARLQAIDEAEAIVNEMSRKRARRD